MVRLRFGKILLVAGLLSVGLPAAAWAQGIAGQVRDVTGGVLPGVTVEAASPALVEQVRVALTDGEGRYNIIELQPGTYTVTFTLPGFSTFVREGIELSTAFTATVNVDLRVGTLEETITVSGQSPVVDIQNVTEQRTLTREIIDSVPIAKNVLSFAAITPGAVVPLRSQDVGGTAGTEWDTVAIHGIRASDMTRMLDGMRFNAAWCTSCTGFGVVSAGVEEVDLQLGNNAAEYERGGVAVNMIPKEGGNIFSGYFFTRYGNDSLQSDNLTDDLAARGLTTPGTIKKVWDVTGTFGGPIVRDKLWFFTSHRSWGRTNTVPGNWFATDPNAPIFVPDFGRPAEDDAKYKDHGLRLTWLAAERHKISASFNYQKNNLGHQGVSSGRAPSGAVAFHLGPPNNVGQLSWKFPATSRLLLEAGLTVLPFVYTCAPTSEDLSQPSILELSTGRIYRSARSGCNILAGGYGPSVFSQMNQRFIVSYVTGSHAFKVGITTHQGKVETDSFHYGNVNYNFFGGVPVSLVQYAAPMHALDKQKMNLGLFVQDQWTIDRMTLNLGLRLDYFNAFVPAATLGAGPFVDERSFGEIPCVPCWKDIGPRVGLAYDLLGDGKTAVKASLGYFVSGEGLRLAGRVNPINTSVKSTSRAWTDLDGDFVPDGDYRDRGANGELGAMANQNFGLPRVTTRFADDILAGWGVRPYNWQITAGVQHELTEGVALDVMYFRTWYGNFDLTDNLAVTSADFDSYSVTAPLDSRLPGGGGFVVDQLADVKPEKFGQFDNLVVQASEFGDQSSVYNGVDVTLSARIANGHLSGGLSTGRTVTDRCFVVDSPQELLHCRVEPPWSALTQVKLAGAYTLPYDVRVSATFQNLSGPPTTANFTASNALVAPSLGRPLAGGRRTTRFNLMANDTTFLEDRVTQIDFRLSKIFQIGPTRLEGNFDIYNLFNTNSVLTLNNTFGGQWQRPFGVLPGRLMQFGAQLSF